MCHGPFFLCQGHHDAEEGELTSEELRAVTGLRAAYVGVLLMPIAPTELLGGTLLHAARALLFGARCTPLAAIVADPQIPNLDPIDAARLAAESIAREGLPDGGFNAPAANRLWKALRADVPSAHYILDAVKLSMRAALASPVTELDGFDLVGVLCDDCTTRSGSASDDRLCAVDTYDYAIRCPVCGVEHAHPLRRQRRIHPVARCFGTDGQPCQTHGGGTHGTRGGGTHGGILETGLCDEGRSIYEAAFAKAGADGNRNEDDEHEPSERRLLDALLRAKKREDLDALTDRGPHGPRPVDPADALWKKLGRVLANALEKALQPEKTRGPRQLNRSCND